MTFFRWILSYLGVMLVIIAVVLGYGYREELMAWFDASDRQQAQATAEPQDTVTAAVPAPGVEQAAEAPATTAPEPTEAAPSFAPPGYEPPGPPPAEPVSEQPSTADTPASAQAKAPGEAEVPSTAQAPTYAPPVPPLVATAPPQPPVATVRPQPPEPAAEARGMSAPPAPEAESATPAPSMPYSAPPPGYRVPPRPAPPVYAETWSRSRAVVVPRPYPAPRPGPRSYPRPSDPTAAISAPPALPEDQRPALSEARDAFWRQGPEAALPLYQALADANVDNPDIQGELANIYFTMGKRAEAAEAYARVVTLLHEQGRRGEAARVLQTVAMLDRDRATELVRQLSPTGAPSGEGTEPR